MFLAEEYTRKIEESNTQLERIKQELASVEAAQTKPIKKRKQKSVAPAEEDSESAPQQPEVIERAEHMEDVPIEQDSRSSFEGPKETMTEAPPLTTSRVTEAPPLTTSREADAMEDVPLEQDSRMHFERPKVPESNAVVEPKASE
jgi:hypothetical protein